MVEPVDFRQALRRGIRVKGRYLQVSCTADEIADNSVLVGFIVPKKVLPNAVDRNRIKRQLRHRMRLCLGNIPAGSKLVIRVFDQPPRGSSWSKELDECLKILVKRIAKGKGTQVSLSSNGVAANARDHVKGSKIRPGEQKG